MKGNETLALATIDPLASRDVEANRGPLPFIPSRYYLNTIHSAPIKAASSTDNEISSVRSLGAT
jgi:hypothetical protein